MPRTPAGSLDSKLGETAAEHIAFIVRTIRDHLWQVQRDQAGTGSSAHATPVNMPCYARSAHEPR